MHPEAKDPSEFLLPQSPFKEFEELDFKKYFLSIPKNNTPILSQELLCLMPNEANETYLKPQDFEARLEKISQHIVKNNIEYKVSPSDKNDIYEYNPFKLPGNYINEMISPTESLIQPSEYQREYKKLHFIEQFIDYDTVIKNQNSKIDPYLSSFKKFNQPSISPALLNKIPFSKFNPLQGMPFGADVFDKGVLEPDDLPELALPIIDFIQKVGPQVVIVCDRGGRLFGVAIHAAWGQTQSGLRFPTVDNKIHFARISTTEDAAVLQERIDDIMAQSKTMAAHRGVEVGEDDKMGVLFIDDWVIGGGTMRLAKQLVEKHGAKAYFAVMCGDGADATGQLARQTKVSWHDRAEEIGVNYLSSLRQNTDGTVTEILTSVPVRTEQAMQNRLRIHAVAKQIVKKYQPIPA